MTAIHANQLNVALHAARAMIREQFPQYATEPVKRLLPNVGTVNSIFRIGTVAAARFAMQPQSEDQKFKQHLHSEAAAMTEFAERCCFPGPRPLGIGTPSADYPRSWSVQTWLDGQTLHEVERVSGDRLARSSIFALDLARLIASLRSVDVRGRVFDGHNRGGHIPNHQAWMETCFSQSENILDVQRLRLLWSSFCRLPRSEGPDVMSHRDLTPANLLVRGERVVGVLDTGSFGPADRALDLVALWHMLEKEQRDVVRKLLEVTDVEWKRGAAWAFEQAMGLVWYYQLSNPTMADMGRRTLRRIVEDDEVSG